MQKVNVLEDRQGMSLSGVFKKSAWNMRHSVGEPIALNTLIFDGFVKSPSAALRCVLRHCSVRLSTPHSSGLARLASGPFY
ncbi:MAG: hypothetical protein AABY87_06420, partial [bacterium]